MTLAFFLSFTLVDFIHPNAYSLFCVSPPTVFSNVDSVDGFSAVVLFPMTTCIYSDIFIGLLDPKSPLDRLG